MYSFISAVYHSCRVLFPLFVSLFDSNSLAVTRAYLRDDLWHAYHLNINYRSGVYVP